MVFSSALSVEVEILALVLVTGNAPTAVAVSLNVSEMLYPLMPVALPLPPIATTMLVLFMAEVGVKVIFAFVPSPLLSSVAYS